MLTQDLPVARLGLVPRNDFLGAIYMVELVRKLHGQLRDTGLERKCVLAETPNFRNGSDQVIQLGAHGFKV